MNRHDRDAFRYGCRRRSAVLFRALGPFRPRPVEEALLSAMEEYRRERPIFSRLVCRIPGWKWDSSHEEVLELARTLQGVAFRPQEAT